MLEPVLVAEAEAEREDCPEAEPDTLGLPEREGSPEALGLVLPLAEREARSELEAETLGEPEELPEPELLPERLGTSLGSVVMRALMLMLGEAEG